MKFYHDVLKRYIKSAKANIKSYEESICNLDPVSGILWDVAEYLELNDLYVSWYSDTELLVHMTHITLEDYELLLNDIDNILEESNYTQDLNYHQDSWRSDTQIFCYTKTGCTDALISIKSNSCEQITTGKLIAETKTNCNFIIK